MVENIVNILKNSVSPVFIVFIISMLPILELRGGLVAAAILGIPWHIAFPICVIGNMLPIPFELLFIRAIFDFLKKIKGIDKLIIKLENRAKKKAEDKSFQKYTVWGLFVLVAVPLPGTGAWTGGLVADFLDMRIKRAFPIILLGVITAGLITSFISYILPMLF